MVVLKWRIHGRRIFQRFRESIAGHISEAMLIGRSLIYNEHNMSQSYVIDILMEPIFWFVDNFAHCLGKVFVIYLTLHTSAVVAAAYWVVLPYWWQQSLYATLFLVIVGNWLLMNIVFHYYMGIVTSPGYPPHGTMVVEAASICKKCITPKPPRTHHCSVCNRCILAMDHHCPWLNNCVGYFNARYFYMYMVYVLAGVTFLIVAGFHIAYQVFCVCQPVANSGSIPNHDSDLIGYPVQLNQSGVVKDIEEYDSVNAPRHHDIPLPVPPITETQRICAHPWKKLAVQLTTFTVVSVFGALLFLTIMHGKNISRGETSVEAHINASARSALGTFSNPYDLGKKKNWKLFLGLTQGRTFIRHVLFPSRHKPVGSGLVWHTISIEQPLYSV